MSRELAEKLMKCGHPKACYFAFEHVDEGTGEHLGTEEGCSACVEREKVREKACKFMCWGCERGIPLAERPAGDNRLTHRDPNGWFECNATLFRQLDLTAPTSTEEGER